MKAFFVNHAEKLFLVVVVLLAGWSLLGSYGSLTAPSVLSVENQNAKDIIDRTIRTRQAEPVPVAPYREWLRANLDGYGIHARATGPVRAPIVHEPPFGSAIREGVTEVPGRLGLPGKPSAASDRARVTVSWAAPKPQENMRAVKFEVLRREEQGPWSAQPVYAAAGLTFIDKDVKPETTYAYKIRAFAEPVPPTEMHTVVPEGLTRAGQLWHTAFVGEGGDVAATTPSDIDFKCSNIATTLEGQVASIVILQWSKEDEGWREFKTEPGIPVGGKVIGTRMIIVNGVTTGKETLDSHYIVKEMKDYFKDVPVPGFKWVLNETTNKPEKVPVTNYRKQRVQEVILKKDDGTGDVTVPVGKGATTRQKEPTGKKPDDKKPGDGATGGVEGFRDMFTRGAASAGEPAGGEEAATPAGPTGVPEGMTRFEDARTTARLMLPKAWTVTDAFAGRLGLFIKASDELNKGLVAAYMGEVEKSGVVIADRALVDAELEALLGKSPAGLPAEEAAGLLAGGLLKDASGVFPKLKAEGEGRAVRTQAGRFAGALAFTYDEGDGSIAIARYCAATPGHLYLLSFVCREKDYESLKGSFEEIAARWTW